MTAITLPGERWSPVLPQPKLPNPLLSCGAVCFMQMIMSWWPHISRLHSEFIFWGFQSLIQKSPDSTIFRTQHCRLGYILRFLKGHQISNWVTFRLAPPNKLAEKTKPRDPLIYPNPFMKKFENPKAQGWGDNAIDLACRGEQARTSFPVLDGSSGTVPRSILFHVEKAGEVLITENSFCCLQCWLTCLEDLSWLCGSYWDGSGFCSLPGKVRPHLHSVEGREGDRVWFELGRSPPGGSLSGAGSAVVVTGPPVWWWHGSGGWRAYAAPWGPSMNVSVIIQCSWKGLEKEFYKLNKITNKKHKKKHTKKSLFLLYRYLSPWWLCCLFTSSHHGALRPGPVPTVSSCWPSKAHFTNENQDPVWTW